MKVVAVVPARMESTRFPGKPLALLLGHPMIEHVYRRTAACTLLDAVYVATCNQEIFQAVQDFGGRAIMTSNKHERASDRVAEAAKQFDADVIVLVQGDEPLVVPDMIQQSVAPFQHDPAIQCVNLTKRITNLADFLNPNTIKVAIGADRDALFFSREPIPTRNVTGWDGLPAFKQVCIIPFTTQGLDLFTRLEPTPLEKAESIDMLRFLEHGYPVRMVETSHNVQAVDTPVDLAAVEEIMQQDPRSTDYLKAPIL